VSHHQLDARRLLCPMPVIRAQNKVKELDPGDTLEVACTDPGALLDIPAWCRINGHEIVNSRLDDNEDVLITIRVGND
jgi:tRNA 2-thiouridine synthesizing protein A